MIDRLDLIINGQTYSYQAAGPSTPHPTIQVLFLSEDVIVHNGLCAPPASVVPAHILAHTARLYSAGQQLGPDYPVPYLEWNGEYMFDQVPDTIVATPQDLVDQNLMFPIGPIVAGKIPPKITVQNTGPGSLGKLAAYMPTTGQRPEIGLLTETSAAAMFNGDFDSALAMARGFRVFGCFIFDERTGGALFDKVKNPKATIYPGQYNTPKTALDYIVIPPAAPSPAPANWATWDFAHTGDAGFFAFCLTHKLRYLRTLCGHANQSLIWSNFGAFTSTILPVVNTGQIRGFFWSLRQITAARRATEMAEGLGLPIASYGLPPSSYWKQLTDNMRAFMRKYYEADPANQRFRSFPMQGYTSPWQDDYGGQVLAWGTLMYPAEFGQDFLWHVGCLKWRLDGSSWPPAIPSCYRILQGPGFSNSKPSAVPLTGKDTDYFPDGATAFATLSNPALYETGGVSVSAADIAAVAKDPYNGDKWAGGTHDYFEQAFAHATLAVRLDNMGLVDVESVWPTLRQDYARQLKMAQADTAAGYIFPARVSFLTGPLGSLPDPGQLPPPVQPPIGGTHMGKPVSVQVGSHVSIPFTYDDGTGKSCQPPTGGSCVSVPPGLVNATVTIANPPDGTGTIDVVGLAQSNAGAVLKLDLQGGSGPVSDQVALTVSVPLPLVGAVHLNP